MTIIKKVFDTMTHVMPDRERDRLTDQHRYLGKPIDRLDGCAKVTGSAPFSAEYPVKGLAHAAMAFSTISKGVIKSIDTKEAEQATGVIKVITHLNAPPMKAAKPFTGQDEPSFGVTAVKILNTDRISWNGQPVAVVVAETEDQAEYAATLIKVTYAAERGMNSFEEAIPSAKKPKEILGKTRKSKRVMLTQRSSLPATE
jgi:xanthine dehydrogenase YagR molybdenum-binding subunit